MKRIILLLAACASLAIAQSRTFTSTVSATGATAGIWVDTNYHTVQTAGTASACTIRLEGSLDGTNWFDLSGTQTCTSSVMFHVDGKPVKFVRANVLTFTGTSIVVTYKGTN